MKPIAGLLLLFILPCSLFAQLKKGQWLIGGVADFSHNSSEEHYPILTSKSKATNYRFMPGAGYFFIDRFCAGLRINISSKKSSKDDAGSAPTYEYVSLFDQTVSGVGLSPFLRYYLLPASRKLNVFVDGSYAYTDETTKIKLYEATTPTGSTPSIVQTTAKYKTKVNNYSLAAGPAIFIGKNISFELSVGYTLGKTKEAPDRTTNSITFGTGFLVYLGK